MAAYAAAILLFRANNGAEDDEAVRWYIRLVEGEGEAWATAAADASGPMLSNEGCLQCSVEAHYRIWDTHWHRYFQPQ